MTLVAYFCATAVVIAATALRSGNRRLRRLRPVAAACGALVPIPLIVVRADEYVGGLATDAVLAGAIVGAIAGFALAGTPNAAVGVGAHLALLWVAALAFLPWVDPTEVYAGWSNRWAPASSTTCSATRSVTTCRRCCPTPWSRSRSAACSARGSPAAPPQRRAGPPFGRRSPLRCWQPCSTRWSA
jgi:hypothetical protein